MSRRLWIILIVLAALVLGLVIYKFVRKPAPAVSPPPESTIEEEAKEQLARQAAALSEADLILLAGRLVVRRIGTYDSWDGSFKNLLSVQSYVTENLNQRLEKIIERGVDPEAPQFEQITTVVDEKILEQGLISAEAVYTVDVWRSDTDKTERLEVTVLLEKFKDWYVADTSQIKE